MPLEVIRLFLAFQYQNEATLANKMASTSEQVAILKMKLFPVHYLAVYSTSDTYSRYGAVVFFHQLSKG